MKKLFVILTLFIGILLSSCNNNAPDKVYEDKEKELLKKELELTKKELELNKKENHEKVEKVQVANKQSDIHDDPTNLIEAIFSAAKSGDLSSLTGLCDPTGSGDGDTKAICNLNSQPQISKDNFRKYFEKGQVIGLPIIEGDKAKVKIKFGLDGTKDEEFNLVRINSKWYLSSY